MKHTIILLSIIFITSCSKKTDPDITTEKKINSISFKLNGEDVILSNKASFPYPKDNQQAEDKFDIALTIPYSTGLGVKDFLIIKNISTNTTIQNFKALNYPTIWNDSTSNLYNELYNKILFARLSNIIIGGDTECEGFIPDTTDVANNWIRNISEEDNFKVVDGEFNLKLIKIKDCPDRNYPDTLYITEGKYHINLKE